MSTNGSQRQRGEYDDAIARGALVNVAGSVARLLQPAFLLFATWMYGPVSMGIFLPMLAAWDLISGLVHAGFISATTLCANSRASPATSNSLSGAA